MGIEKGRFSRLQGRGIDKNKAHETHADPASPIAREPAEETTPQKTIHTSRLLSKSPISPRDKTESLHRTINITLGMKVVQRDDPKVDWEVSGIHGNIVVLYNRNSDTSVSKKIDRFINEINTPGSPWRL